MARVLGRKMVRIKNLFCLSKIFFLILLGFKICIAEELKIASFETDEDLAKFEKSEGVIIERSNEHVTDGKYSLKATFLAEASGEYRNIIIRHPNYPTRDFSAYDF